MKPSISKRRLPWVRVAVYGLMTTTVVVIVALLMLVVLGYSFNQRDGRLEQGGLLQFSSVPTGATVVLNELTLGQRTNTKATVDAGSHSVTFTRDGYRSWKKTIVVEPGQIGWLNYARLIPNKIETQSMRNFEQMSGSLASPGRNWLLLHEFADKPSFELANLQNDTLRYTTLTLPTESYTAPAEGVGHTFALDSWSMNENAVLVKHMYEDKTEWILLNRDEPQKSVNLNKAFGVSPSKVVFAGGGDRLLFVQTDDAVRRINLGEQTLSRPLATQVQSFAMYDEKTIAYTALQADQKRVVGYANIDISQPVTLHTYENDGQPLYAVMKTYFNKRYLSIIHGQKLKIETGSKLNDNVRGDLKEYAHIDIPTGATRLTVSQNGRFVITELADGYGTYDLELKKFDKTTWGYPSATQRPLQWLDDYIVWSDNGGKARIYDFDGANQHTLMEVAEGNAVSISSNGKYFYGIARSDKGFDLSRIQLLPN